MIQPHRRPVNLGASSLKWKMSVFLIPIYANILLPLDASELGEHAPNRSQLTKWGS